MASISRHCVRHLFKARHVAACNHLTPSSRYSTTDTNNRPRRVIFNIPGSEPRKLQKAASIQADSIVFDLEDGVALGEKENARELVLKALREIAPNLGLREVAVRINGLGTGWEEQDLKAVLPSPNLHALILPKISYPQDIHALLYLIEKYAPFPDKIALLPTIETARGVINASSICDADPRVKGVIFGAEDYCADTGVKRTTKMDELLYARSTIVTAAKAARIQAIDLVCIDFKSTSQLQFECESGKTLGFTGKQAIHPSQISPILSSFTPSSSEFEFAKEIVNKSQMMQGKVFECRGKVIDTPVVKWAINVCNEAEWYQKLDGVNANEDKRV